MPMSQDFAVWGEGMLLNLKLIMLLEKNFLNYFLNIKGHGKKIPHLMPKKFNII